jgi:hypothetical protein
MSASSGMTIKGILTRDSICRRDRKWKLLSFAEMEEMFDNQGLSYDDAMYSVAASWDTPKMIESWKKVQWRAIKNISSKFPHARKLLEVFKGQIVAAGGAVSKALIGEVTRAGDIDLFFIDESCEDQRKYTELLVSAVSLLVSEILSVSRGTVYLTRNEHVTSVCFYHSEGELDQKYQFIHRVYPNIGSILGGFDIGFCMTAFDGDRILATELGAWSVLYKTIIVDTSRRSTSYEHRLTKYSHMCKIIFPGLTASKVEESFKERKSASEVKTELSNILEKEEVNVRHISFGQYNDEYRGFYSALRSDAEEIIHKENLANLMKKIHDLVSESDFYIHKLDLKEKDRDSFPLNIELEERIGKMLKDCAYKRGFFLDVEEFKMYLLDGYDSSGLSSRKRTFAMPYLSIKTKQGHSGPSIFATKMSHGETKYNFKMSDYDDKPVWASMMSWSNITCLSSGDRHLKGAASIIVFKRPLEDLEPIRLEGHGYTDVAKVIKNIHEVTSVKEIEKLVDHSFSNPYLGEIGPAFNERLEYYTSLKKEKPANSKRLLKSIFGYNEERDPVETFQRIKANACLAEENLKGVRWITENPGRQWTSSINPIIADPRDWYGPSYTSFRIGCQEVETAIRLLRLRKSSPFFHMDRNVFNYIVKLVVWENSYLM